jgi:hypothetical protein
MVSTFHVLAFLIILLTVRQMKSKPLLEEQFAQ